jgi:hypothetical protein
MSKISNQTLKEIIFASKEDISLSLADCCKKLGLNHPTVYGWQKKLKDESWPKNYKKTEDGVPLSPDNVNGFISCCAFSSNIPKILEKFVDKKFLANKYSFTKQAKILKNLFKKYPDVNFWLYCDFGKPRGDMLYYTGKGEKLLKKKFLDFNAKYEYTKVEYNYKPEKSPLKDKKKNLWDYY